MHVLYGRVVIFCMAILAAISVYTSSLSAMEPLPITLEFAHSGGPEVIPQPIRRAVEELISETVSQLPRFTAAAPENRQDATYVLQCGISSYFTYEDMEDESQVVEVVLDGRLYDGRFPGQQPVKSFTITVETFFDSFETLPDNLVSTIAADLKQEIQMLYILTGNARRIDRLFATVDIGGNLGVEEGQYLLVSQNEPGSTPYLLQVEAVSPESSTARIVRRHGSIGTDGTVEELPESVGEIRINTGIDLPPNGFLLGENTWKPMPTVSIELIGNPYGRYFYGGGIRVFAVEDSRNWVDPGLGFLGLAGVHILRAPRVRISLIPTLHLDTVYRPDSENRLALAFVPAISVAVETTVVATETWDVFVATGYRISPTVEQWSIVDSDEKEPVSASFVQGRPTVRTSGIILSAGVRIVEY